LRISVFFGQPENVRKTGIYDIFEKVIAARHFPARALLVAII